MRTRAPPTASWSLAWACEGGVGSESGLSGFEAIAGSVRQTAGILRNRNAARAGQRYPGNPMTTRARLLLPLLALLAACGKAQSPVESPDSSAARAPLGSVAPPPVAEVAPTAPAPASTP